MIQELTELYNATTFGVLLRISITILIGLGLTWLLRRLTKNWLALYASHHIAVVAASFVWYTGLLLILTTVMHELGFHFATLLGAAGILGVAIGFAAQTSFSNIISGIFLLIEHSFEVGDYIVFEEAAGTIESIGLLSISLRTLDNMLIRIPNETLLKNIFTNWSTYPVVRLRILVRIPSTASIEAAKEIMVDTVSHSSFVLKDPAPKVILKGTTYWSSELEAKVWVAKNDYIDAKEELIAQLKQRGDSKQVSMAISGHK